MSISAILLAGGKGRRLGGPLPKQYLPLEGKPIACHSLEILLAHPDITQCIVVCAPEFRSYFAGYSVQFAEPGKRRQDSLYNGLQLVENAWVCTHDAARPFLTNTLLNQLIESGRTEGAATLALPVKYTLKEGDQNGFVERTVDRAVLWEIQTPQFLAKELLDKGFEQVGDQTVTDDVSLAELVGHRVKLVLGSPYNLKVTTPEDLIVCQSINSHSRMREQPT